MTDIAGISLISHVGEDGRGPREVILCIQLTLLTLLTLLWAVVVGMLEEGLERSYCAFS